MSGIKNNVMFIRHVLMMVFSNIPRLILSICGLFVGLLVLTTGNILMNSYYDEAMNRACEFTTNNISVLLEADDEFEKKLITDIDTSNVEMKKVYKSNKSIYVEKYSNGNICSLNAKVVGTTSMDSENVMMKYNENTIIPVHGELKKGRFINQNDVSQKNNCVVIDEFTASLLFGEEDPIGKKVTLGVGNVGMSNISDDGEVECDEFDNSFIVVGVFNNSQVTKSNQLEFSKFMAVDTGNIVMSTYIYIPYTTLDDEFQEETQDFLVWNYKDKSEYENGLQVLNDYKTVYSSKYSEFEILTKDDMKLAVKKELRPVKLFMWLILSALLIISGINSMNTMFFSIKERIGEIGIKKAMGANASDIIIQFLMEGVFMAYIAALIALIIGGIIAGIIGEWIQSMLFISFKINYSSETILFTLIVAGLYGIAFSFIPSYYGAGRKVADALRFE